MFQAVDPILGIIPFKARLAGHEYGKYAILKYGARPGGKRNPDGAGRNPGCRGPNSRSAPNFASLYPPYSPNSFSALPCAMRSLSAALTGICSRKARAFAIEP